MTIRVDKHNRGYVPMHQTPLSGQQADLKESFNVGMGLTRERSRSERRQSRCTASTAGPELEGFRDPVEAYFDAVTALGKRLARAAGDLPRHVGAG